MSSVQTLNLAVLTQAVVIWRRHALVVRTAAMVVLLAFVLWRIDVTRSLENVRDARPAPLAIAALLVYFAWLVNSFKWQRLLAGAGIHRGLAELFRLNLASIFYGLALPGHIAGEVLKAIRLGGSVERRGVVYASVWLDRVTGLTGLSMVGIAGLLFAPPPVEAWRHLYLVVQVVVLSLSVLVLLLPKLPWPADGNGEPGTTTVWTASLARLAHWRYRLITEAGMDHGLAGMAGAVLLACVFQAANVASNWAIAQALGVQISPFAIAWVTAVFSILQLLPLSLAGIGLRDVTFVALLGLYGVVTHHALAMSLLMLSLVLMLGLTGWLVDLLPRRQRDQPRRLIAARLSELRSSRVNASQ
ncbi:MAG: flippase-like domain-containing protein [Chloroflexi bacterium]|nr:flippase-like domain-containing protein [Chloroflexota bacterium]